MTFKETIRRIKNRERFGSQGLARVWELKATLLLLVMFQTFDTLSTVLALGTGQGQEANPILRPWFEGGNATDVVMIKWLVVAFAFVVVAVDPRDTKSDFVKWGLIIMNAIYAVVLSWNFAVYGAGTGDWALPSAFWALMCLLAIVMVDEDFFDGQGAAWMVGKFRRSR